MHATFLVTLDLSDTDLLGTADLMKDDLLHPGYNVVEVKPWHRESVPTEAAPLAGVPTPLKTTVL